MRGKANSFTKAEKSWILYDWANSVYATNMTAAIFPIYYATVAGDEGNRWWGLGVSAASLLVAVLAPVLGAAGDTRGMKKKLLAGFLLMGQRYALLLAAVTALVDALPVFGTGTVLLPWAAACLLLGQAPRAVALAALYAVISAVRSFLEPKVMAAQAGHDLGGPSPPGGAGGYVRRLPGLRRGGHDPAACGAAVRQAAP